MKACLLIEEDRTQRQSVVLQGCALPHHGPDCAPAGFPGSAIQLYNQFERRVKRGRCSFSRSWAPGSFRPISPGGSTGETPIQESLDLGLMVYDVFDLNIWKVGKQAEHFCLPLPGENGPWGH